MSDPGDLLAAFQRLTDAGDPWRRPLTICPACEGRGWLQVGTHRGWKAVECFDCGGSGKGDATEDKDISNDE